MKLFERFDKAYCVNLDSRPDRLESFQKQAKKFNLGNYTRVSAVDGKTLAPTLNKSNLLNGEVGLILTLGQIIDDAIKLNLESILFMEDDCLFSEEIINVQNYFDLLPTDWDMLYMGGNHNTHVGVSGPIKVNEKVLKLHHTYSAHFVGIKKSVFDLLKYKTSLLNEPIDVSLAFIQKKFNAYCFYPALVTQKNDFSDIQNKHVNYSWLIK